MKRTLAIGCAAIALTAVAGTASAQTKFDVIVGGDYKFQGAWIDEDNDSGTRSTEFANRFRLNITPTAKADNGLEYGARLRLRAVSNGTVDNDRAFMFLKGGFGTVQLGTINGLSDEYGVIGPLVDGISGNVDDGDPNFIRAGNNYLPSPVDNFRTPTSGAAYTRLNYLTPTFAGFQAGVSYAPQSDKGTAITRTHYGADGVEDIVEVGGTYSGEFGGVTVAASGFYEWGDVDPTSGAEDVNSWTVGLSVGFGPAAIGGFYVDQNDSYRPSGSDQKAWSVNGTYTLGPIILGAGYMYAKEDVTGFYDVDMDEYSAGITYTIAPGLTAGVEYNYYNVDASGPAAPTVGNSHMIMVDTRLAF